MKKEKVVLAYSGGLDTSVCVKWLAEKKNLDVICVCLDLGQGLDAPALEKKALASGAKKLYVIDAREEFVRDFVLPALKAGAVYEGKYFLATALGRPLIARKLVEAAEKEKAGFVAHGCTGKGNDQVRIEVGVKTLNPRLKIIAPVREWEFTSREEEIDYARKQGIPVTATRKSPYSLDDNLWGVSIECGALEDPETEPPADCYQITGSPEKAAGKSEYVTIEFERGVPVKVNGKNPGPVELIAAVSRLGAAYGIGRSDLIENRLVGIKSREIYEAPAAVILHTAHNELEALVLDRELAHFKAQLALKYSELVYYGLWYSPLKSALDAFVEKTQENVTGIVRIKLSPGRCEVAGRNSPHSLYRKELATYEKGDKFDQSLAHGFIEIWGLPYRRK